ncbi:Sec-independent protein translocase subunit TatA [Streptosporangium sp. NPDC051022]|uniref:Sec-independent protein translocase subunit TatA n=1 Tax=Streptosporangium sp. NPDC051022 TaxID=3155752 RepID=UPI00343368FE
MADLGAGEILIIALVLVVLFGSKKLPDMARSIGRSLRVFKAETTKLHEEDEPRAQPAPAARPASAVSLEEQARQLEEQAARLRAQAAPRQGGEQPA